MNKTYKIEEASKVEADFIIDKLVDYNLNKVNKIRDEAFIDIVLKVMDNGQLIGGLVAKIYCWNVMYLDALWIKESHRKIGIGKELIYKLEEIAKENKVNLIHLDTFTFQNKDFYVKLGYEVFGELKDCPTGYSRYYLKKNI